MNLVNGLNMMFTLALRSREYSNYLVGIENKL